MNEILLLALVKLLVGGAAKGPTALDVPARNPSHLECQQPNRERAQCSVAPNATPFDPRHRHAGDGSRPISGGPGTTAGPA